MCYSGPFSGCRRLVSKPRRAQVVAGKAEPRSPVQAAHLDVGAAGSPKDASVSACTGASTMRMPAGAKDSDGFAQCPGAFFLAVDVGEGVVADHDVI